MAPTKPDADAKIQAIVNAPEEHLRAILKVACTGDERTLQRLRLALSRVKKFEKQASESAANNKRKAAGAVPDSTADAPDSTLAKRVKLIEDVHHCVRCDKAFLQIKNHKKACWYHPCEFPNLFGQFFLRFSRYLDPELTAVLLHCSPGGAQPRGQHLGGVG